MTSRDAIRDHQRASIRALPPEGAALASFVLFASLATLLAIAYAASEWLSGGFGLASDAAWARLVFARNVASVNGVCFNPGTPVAGAPGPAWIGCLAAVGFVTGKFLLSAKLLGLLCVILAAFLAWHLALDLLGDWRFAFLAGLLVAASPRLVPAGLGGTEAALAALLLAAAIHWQARGWESTALPRAVGGCAVALAALSRPEILALVPLVLVDRWLVAALHPAAAGQRLRRALARSLPELGAAALLLAPYLLHNWRAGGPLWQQPESVLRAQPAWTWALGVLGRLWADNPLLLCSATVGLAVAAFAAVRARSGHTSFLLILVPVVMSLAPGLVWPYAGPTNTEYAAAYLTPLVAVLGSAGLFFLHRLGRRLVMRAEGWLSRWQFGAAIAVTCAALLTFAAGAHRASWQQHGFGVEKVTGLQGFIGRWAADHLPLDASIASREVGAIGFFSRRRMADLGGTINQEGLRYLSRPGSPDSNLLDYLQKVRPSHLAIRPGDFPDLSQRTELLTPAVTCVVPDPIHGGVTTMTLYETPWPPPSIRGARGEAGSR